MVCCRAKSGHSSIQISGDEVLDVFEYLGSDTFLIVDCGALGNLTVRTTGDTELKIGTKFGLAFDEQKLHFFNPHGKRC